jgi:hypothetical protein
LDDVEQMSGGPTAIYIFDHPEIQIVISVETGAQVDGRVNRLTREEPAGLKLIASA